MYLWLFLFTLVSAQTTASPLDIFLQTAVSKNRPHPTRPELSNHFYSLYEGQPTAIVFLPGMGEPSIKYYELFDILRLTQTTFYGWDHIGQGFSSHLLPEQPQKVHLDSFSTHIAPLKNFFEDLRKKHTKIIVIAHSMGAHLALRTAIENPNLIDLMVLTSPLIKINTSWVPATFVEWLLHFYDNESYPPLYSLLSHKKTRNTFVTNSLKRQEEFKKTIARFPEIKRQGATVGWLKAAFESTKEFQKLSRNNLTMPLLILQAETDYLVDNKEQVLFCAEIKNCKIEVIKNSKHEILFETDEVRSQTIDKIRNFILLKTEKYKEVNP
jgi:lysophospholipase